MSQEKVWNKIAESWTENRQKGHPEVRRFLRSRKGRILEAGCGNCRNLVSANKKRNDLYGIDFSRNMLRVARKYCKEHKMKVILKKADVKKIPFKDNFFDAVVCVAVLHIINKGRIEKPLKEIKRVMKPGASALISVWYKKEKGERLKPWFKKYGGKKVSRYYYFFDEKEMKGRIKKAGLEITDFYVSGAKNRKNLFFEVRKPL